MSSAGWYPDPGGRPGRYRWWDGAAWSAQTTTDPRTPPPTGPIGPTVPPAAAATRNDGKRRTGFIALLALGLVVLLIGGVLLVRGLTQGTGVADPEPTSTVSGWDDSSPLPTATPSASPSPTPRPSARTPTPSPTAVDPAPLESCPVGDPNARADHPNDGRVHGGGLSFSSPGSDWLDADSYTDGLSWAYDVAGIYQTTEPGWASVFAVGALHTDDGFRSPRQAAAGVMQCVSTSGYYHDVTSRKDVVSRAVTVDGRPGWELRTEVRVDNPGLSVPGDLVDVIVVDTGQSGSLGMFVGAVPIGDQARTGVLTTLVDSLRLG
ncbi:hypothetical protein FHX74_002062 [Friedmanniella endophytica]|uniref:DUF2510 domain-containing protein n=1 Tax=Microlunatus kandeliicorticis TaxID=1759536 RepID=A0A7W3P607_9ACTN|nr:DUF2510 domain-containing protein [Microlunatus kandeliicorticis]MBA8794443.1 hypothetical protein [Microlunatus kandeliicorticis]